MVQVFLFSITETFQVITCNSRSFKTRSILNDKDGQSLGRIQDLTKGGSDKRPPEAVARRGVRGHAPPENF